MVFVVDGPAEENTRPECFRVFECGFTSGMLEIYDVCVGLGDNVVGCIHCEQLFDDFAVWCQFHFFTCAAQIGQTGTFVEGGSAEFLHAEVE